MKRVLLALLIAVLSPSMVASPAESRMIFGFNDSPEVFADESGAAKGAGARIARVAFSWEAVEPEPGQYHWSPIDRAVASLRAQGVRQLFAIAAPPEWAAPSRCSPKPPVTCGVAGRHRSDYAEFARELLSRYPGSKLQAWNEPNIRLFGAMSSRQAARLTMAAHRVAPRRVIGPAAAPSDDGSQEYLARLYAALPRSIPMAIHLYPRTSFAVQDPWALTGTKRSGSPPHARFG